MKNIEINEKQKEMLLEMCNKLFPEYFDIYLEIKPQYDGIENHIQLTKTDKDDTVYVHWFEFCMTHLAEKIINPKDLNNKKIKQDFIDFFMEMNAYSWFIQDPGIRESFTDHPIDYLYNKFKTLTHENHN